MTTETTPKECIENAIKNLGLTLEYKFVPFSQSRNKANKTQSLNWIITLKRGRGSMSFDYSAGCGHCPANKTKDSHHKRLQIAEECENGFATKVTMTSVNLIVTRRNKPLTPDAASVMCSLVLDASVLDSGSFDEWATDFGYDTDSRAAEAVYNACLQQALQLRRLVGDEGLRLLQDASRDY